MHYDWHWHIGNGSVKFAYHQKDNILWADYSGEEIIKVYLVGTVKKNGELVNFCRENGSPASGGKIEITDRIAYFLDTSKVLSVPMARKKATAIAAISEDTKIESNFVCSEKHRAFFREHIGSGFSFNVAFQKWLKNNTGKTYKEAIAAYYQILEDKKKGKTKIEKQFEYNTYIRDFFEDNEGKSLEEAIKC